MTPTELIAALEAATGPSRELDGEIALAVNAVPVNYSRRGVATASARAEWWDDSRETCWWSAPHFSASLDAAMTLVPDKMGWEMDNWPQGKMLYHAAIRGGHGLSNATSAIALCIAALKARLP